MSELYGREAENSAAGFTEMPGAEKKARSSFDTPREAADALTEQRGDGSPVVKRVYLDEHGEPMPGLREDGETTTIERAADDLIDLRKQEFQKLRDEDAASLREKIDVVREQNKAPEAEQAEAPTAEKPLKEGEVHPEVERLLKNPQVRQAVEQHFGEIDRTKQAYSEALDRAQQFTQASFTEHFPEIATLPVAQWQRALETMAHQDPTRFAKAMGTLGRAVQLHNAQQWQERQAAVVRQREFQQFAKAEDAKIDADLSKETPARQKAIMDEILLGAKDAGLAAPEFLKMFGSEKLLRHSAFQKMMTDAAKYRLMLKGQKAIASSQLPPVLRPGVASPRLDSAQQTARDLKGKFRSDPSLKNAAALLLATRKK